MACTYQCVPARRKQRARRRDVGCREIVINRALLDKKGMRAQAPNQFEGKVYKLNSACSY